MRDVSVGFPYLAIPGPSVIPDRVQRAMHRASPNIYTGELVEITASCLPDLKRMAGTNHQVAIYIGNGHATWEAMASNLFAPGDAVLAIVGGRFGEGWAEVSRKMGADVRTLEVPFDGAIAPEALEDALRADTAHKIKAVLAVHVDTSTGAKADLKALRAAIDAANHPALFCVDAIASFGCDRIEMDESGIDVLLAASQKGLMLPPGLGFVWLSERALAASAAVGSTTPYWDWAPRIAPEFYYQYFFGTAPTHHIYGLREALDMIAEEGLEARWARHETLAKMIWAAVDHWGQGGEMALNVPDPNARGHSVTSVRMAEGEADRLRAWVEEHCEVTLGIGLGREPASAYFRIGHMGYVNAQMVMGVLGSIEAALIALNIPHNPGGTGAAAQVLAQASR